MPARSLSIVGFILIALGSATQVSADWCFGIVDSIAADVKRRQCWPDPFVAPDRAAAITPLVTMVNNGWRRQNMLGEFHFEPSTGQLTEAGRLKVRQILTVVPPEHRQIYVHSADTDEETSARIAAVQQWSAHVAPKNPPPVMSTSISDDGWPASQVDLIGRKFQSSMPLPRLPAPTEASSSSSGK